MKWTKEFPAMYLIITFQPCNLDLAHQSKKQRSVCSCSRPFLSALAVAVHQSGTVKNVGRMHDETRLPARMIYIPEDLVIRAMRKYADAGDLEPRRRMINAIFKTGYGDDGGASFRGAT